MIRARGCAVAVLLAAALAACSSTDGRLTATRVGTVSASRQHGPKLAISAGGTCPLSLGRAVDVTNHGASRSLLPAGALPRSGLICEFHGSTTGTPASRLARTVHLDPAKARLLARAVARVSLAPATGAFSCPAEFYGDDTVIAFGYAGSRSVDLWFATSGCRTLDNGTVQAFEGANPSFYNGFETAFTTVTAAR